MRPRADSNASYIDRMAVTLDGSVRGESQEFHAIAQSSVVSLSEVPNTYVFFGKKYQNLRIKI